MRAVVTRVTSASVSVDGAVVGAIDPPAGSAGLLVLVGATHSDTVDVARALAEKIWRLRILDGEVSAADVGAPVLVVSQFTLYANVSKGRRPSWNAAAPGPVAQPLVDEVVKFGAHMIVSSVNDGPVTIQIEL